MRTYNESLTDNLSDDVAKKLLEWLEYLARNESAYFDQMLQFTKGLNKAKVAPLSHKGKDLNNSFEIVLVNTDPESNMLIRYATYLTEQGAVHAFNK